MRNRLRQTICLSALLAAAPLSVFAAATPDFGPNVAIFDPKMPQAAMQAKINAAYAVQQHNEFGPQRNAFVFLPGDYKLDVPVGFYTEVIGAGATPDAVHISGNVHADASEPNNNATTTFWRAIEGIAVSPSSGTMQWAVSQAVPFRRMHVKGNLVLHQNHGWASGGWMSDSLTDGNVDSGTQQQWISRNSEWHSWTGSNWNMVFVGVPQQPQGEWPQPPYTKIDKTPVVREKPFLEMDRAGAWSVRVPSMQHESAGISWHNGATPGHSIPLSHFYIAKAGHDSAATINAALAKGKDLLLTPGIYELDEPIEVKRPDAVVMGLGFATLKPMKGKAAMTTADVDGIIVAGILFDGGPTKSPYLLQIGPQKSKAVHTKNPISLHDVFFRVGGAGIGRVTENLEINSRDTIVDHTWIWRADHGKGVGWISNVSDNGLVVNADYVTIYGLFVEHHQGFQVLWNGNHGRTYFYQSEIPYDPPAQYMFTSGGNADGWASYKVDDKVTSHEAWGLGIYSVFTHPNVKLGHAIEVPQKPEVKFHHMITVALGNHGEISNVINNTGGATKMNPRVTPKVTDYPAK
ncbi:coagulation factor 5/8 type domain-containing protein [Silvibacterium acidisoli]|uniref:coagulation factor 5/8 type domain-containing protein n=1 Tax=Acidobacteriaceae bacterium ZG23-2 TaxID=2883246 RepID=UPI00406C829A